MHGKTIAILETRLGRQLVELVEKRGGCVMHASALAEVPAADPFCISNTVLARKRILPE